MLTDRVVIMTFADALARVRQMQARDDARILPASRTLCLQSGRASHLAVVLFHGFTNSPAQYARFAALLESRGCNVLVPRLPGHGDVDRMTTRLESVTGDQYLATALEAIGIACALGRRVAVSGISLGGILCAWLAARTECVDRAVIVAPNFALPHLPFAVSNMITGGLRVMPPNVYNWWDPRQKERIPPRHGYPRYPLRALGECYALGKSVMTFRPPLRGRDRTRAVFALNRTDPAVNNAVTRRMADRWRERSMLRADTVMLDGLPAVHDIIEPESPHQRVDLVYPRLLDLIMRDE